MIYFIMVKPLPTLEEQPYGPAWWDMDFVNCNGHPQNFSSETEAREYMKVWEMEEPQYTVWKLDRVWRE